MPDNFLLILFGILSTAGLTLGIVSFALAMRHAKKPDGELKMALWAIAGMGGLVLAGMSWAYFLIPILLNKLF